MNTAGLEYVLFASFLDPPRRCGACGARAQRYALALALGGRELPASEMGLHACDNTVCVRVVDPATAAPGVQLHGLD